LYDTGVAKVESPSTARDPKKWLERAKTDLESSQLLYGNGIYSNCVFLLQQAVEKAAKAVLVVFNEGVGDDSLLGRYVTKTSPERYGHKWEKGFLARMNELAQFATAFYPDSEDFGAIMGDLPADFKKNQEHFQKFADEKELRRFVNESKGKIIANLPTEIRICKQLLAAIESSAVNHVNLGSMLQSKMAEVAGNLDSLLQSNGFNRRARRILLGRLRYIMPTLKPSKLIQEQTLAVLKEKLTDKKLADEISEAAIRGCILIPLLVLGFVLNPFAIEARYPGSFEFKDASDPLVAQLPDLLQVTRLSLDSEEKFLDILLKM
ncbi:MAG: HEPN domain-containing protein, partial [Rhabdochlamydiaceae bacterium]